MLALLDRRLTRTERGLACNLSGCRPYTEVYTQQWWRYYIGEAYHHVWERTLWPIWYRLERFDHSDDKFHVPLSNRLELRCFDLRHKGRVRVSFNVEGEDDEAEAGR